MAKLEGIIYNTFYGYVVLRGFAPIGDLADISKRPPSYQRNADNQHKLDIVRYLSGTNSYFPEITLACRVQDYEGLIQSIGTDKDISKEESAYVKGLYVLSERLPIGRDRARHAYLEIKKPTEEEKMLRVDGNHRLEPFSSDIEWWYQLVEDRSAIDGETDPDKRKGWLDHQANEERDKIAKKIVPFTIIMSDGTNEGNANNFEAKIFHDINFKAKPLREEASLKIISELKAFEIDKLGDEYPLTIELIEEVKRGVFNNIPWLKVEVETEKSYFRTSCLRIVQLLFSQRGKAEEMLAKVQADSSELEKKVTKQQQKVDNDVKKIADKVKDVQNLEINNPSFKDMSLYKETNLEIEASQLELNLAKNELDMLVQERTHIKYKIETLKNYLEDCSRKEAILSTITDLTAIYRELGSEHYGNISYLCALVYYSLLDRERLRSFIDWSKQNGINKITQPDDLSKDASINLITMFDQIHLAKKNEIFVSMQFGDSQSELIFEKIVRAIEKFNSKNPDVSLRVTPIRIDRNVDSNIFSIPERIKTAIQSCGLFIADLSSANINVYHEIGYAMGIAESHGMVPNIILLYKENTSHNKDKTDKDKFVGFNLRNFSQLRFTDYEQLVGGLLQRLEKYYRI